MPQRRGLPTEVTASVYLVLDRQAARPTVVTDLLSGRYRHPLRVVVFDAFDRSTHDVSAEIAAEVLSDARELDSEVPAAVRAFVERAGL
jgi:hypothetical protein